MKKELIYNTLIKKCTNYAKDFAGIPLALVEIYPKAVSTSNQIKNELNLIFDIRWNSFDSAKNIFQDEKNKILIDFNEVLHKKCKSINKILFRNYSQENFMLFKHSNIKFRCYFISHFPKFFFITTLNKEDSTLLKYFSLYLREFVESFEMMDEIEELKSGIQMFDTLETEKTLGIARGPIHVLKNYAKKIPSLFEVYRIAFYFQKPYNSKRLTFQKYYDLTLLDEQNKNNTAQLQKLPEVYCIDTADIDDKKEHVLKISPKENDEIENIIYQDLANKIVIFVQRNFNPSIIIQFGNLLNFYIESMLVECQGFYWLFHCGQQFTTGLASEMYNSLTVLDHYVKQINHFIKQKSSNDLFSVNMDLNYELKRLEKKLTEYSKFKLPLTNNFLKVDIKSIFEEALNRIPSLFTDFAIKINIIGDCFFSCHKNLLVTAFFEVLINILHHAYPDGPSEEQVEHIRFIAKCEKVDDLYWLIVQIKDFGGRNISQEDLENFFEPGWRKQQKSYANGMGLTFVRYIIEQIHWGSVRVLNWNEGENSGINIEIMLPGAIQCI